MTKNSFVLDNHNDEANDSSISLWSQNRINGYIDNKLVKLLIKNNFKLRISTLGPDGTSSEHAANYYLSLLNINSSGGIMFRPQFEDSMTDVLEGRADVMIVANAYRNIETFYMNHQLELISSFKCITPNYGIASLKDYDLQAETDLVIITHPAPHCIKYN